MRTKGGIVYIVSNKSRTVLYIGVTTDLRGRIAQHKAGTGSAFTSQYKCTDLLYYEHLPTIIEAIRREKQLKKWKRRWKEELIQQANPKLHDLSEEI